MYHNVEKSAFTAGEYTGYAKGPWRVRKDGREWLATKRDGSYSFTATTLKAVSEKLERLNKL
jgi:hypothetical protein